MYVLSIKVPIQKKSGKLFNDPRNCVETITMLECKQINSNPFKKFMTDKLISYISFVTI